MSLRKTEGALGSVFQGMRNLSVRCVITSCKLGPGCRFPDRGRKLATICPRSRSPLVFPSRPFGPSPTIGRAGKNAPCPSSTMSSAGYSSKGCSPALPLSASPVTISINLLPFPMKRFIIERYAVS
jgi:hypothetical protein